MRLHPENDPIAIQLSQSSLEAYFQCPWRLKLSSQWKRKPEYVSSALTDGTHAHALLEGKQVQEASPSAVGYYESLMDLQVRSGIEIWAHEVQQVVHLFEDVYYKRILDGIGLYKGTPVIIDYKTSGKGPWPYFRSGRSKVIPKAHSFQAVSYLIAPNEQSELDRFGLSAWPETFLFLVSDAMGHGEVVAYQKDAEMEENFLTACRVVADAIRKDQFPRYHGGSCGLLGTSWACSYLEMCYQTPGWQDVYEPAYSEVEEV